MIEVGLDVKWVEFVCVFCNYGNKLDYNGLYLDLLWVLKLFIGCYLDCYIDSVGLVL